MRRSSWGSIRLLEHRLQRDLRQRHTLWLHGGCIGGLTLGVTWAVSALQMALGNESLALRYLVSLGAGYLCYLGLLRLWAAALVPSRREGGDGLVEVPDIVPGGGPGSGGPSGNASLPSIPRGGGGDFAGGGASGDFADAVDFAQAVPLETGGGLSELASGAAEVVAGADEGAVIVIPVLAVFLAGAAVFFGAGALLLLYFGWEVLLAVAVELAFAWVSTRAGVRVAREGWLSAAVRLTWKPLLGALLCAVLLGALVDHFVPRANSLPEALRVLRGR